MSFDMSTLKALKNMDGDDVLETLGLRRRSSFDWLAPAVTALGVGILVGAGLGLMLAPKSGSDLRDDLRNRLGGEGEAAEGNSSLGATPPAREPAIRGA
jgi:hypothetical protein